MPNHHINLNYLNEMTDGDEDMRQTMLEMILDEVPSEMEKMRDQWLSGDLAGLKETSHKMKSTLAFVGNRRLTEANAAVEQIARGNGQVANLANLFWDIEEELPFVLNELGAVLAV